MANCGVCLMKDVVLTELDAKGKCPRCGTNYGAAGRRKPATVVPPVKPKKGRGDGDETV